MLNTVTRATIKKKIKESEITVLNFKNWVQVPNVERKMFNKKLNPIHK